MNECYINIETCLDLHLKAITNRSKIKFRCLLSE